MNLPTLYKKTSTGAIQEWSIRVDFVDIGERGELGGGLNGNEAEITTVHGQVGGKLQSTTDIIREGKNVGRANETSPIEQAEAEAQAKWEKQKKKGYVETKEAAQAGEVDALIEGGVVPMLAQSFSKHAAKIKYPCNVQPKLYCIRCIAILKDGKCTLWSRTRKLITGVPHIAREVEKLFAGRDIILDGELYNHDFKKDFEKIVSFVRQEDPADGHEVVEYHVYDVVNENAFADRAIYLYDQFHHYQKAVALLNHLVLVPTGTVNSEEDVMESFALYLEHGYEGAMLRNSNSLYVNKRSYDLQKVKEFDDAEFEITGVEEGRGKLAGHAIFVCKTDKGSQFLAKMKGDTARLKEYFDNHSLWQGKKLTVQYQGLTGKENVPRFPVGVAIRDYE